MSSSSNQLKEPNAPKLTRHLSVEYDYKGVKTMADPDSFSGAEKKDREDALLKQRPQTGYANWIRASRKRPSFFKPYANSGDFLDTLLQPIAVPVVLAFNSIYHLVQSLVSALDCLLMGSFSLIAKPFSEAVSKDSKEQAAAAFTDARINWLFSVTNAACSVWSVVESLLKLLTRTVSTLWNAATKPAVVKEDASYCSYN